MPFLEQVRVLANEGKSGANLVSSRLEKVLVEVGLGAGGLGCGNNSTG